MNIRTAVLVFLGVLLNTIAQFLLKAGAGRLGPLHLAYRSAVNFFLAAASSSFILGGMVCYVASFGLWVGVLSRMEVSIAYPLLAVGYVISAFAAYFIFGEPLSAPKLVGIAIIVVGVAVLARA